MASTPLTSPASTIASTAAASPSPLKLLVQAKIACANCVHDLETLDGLSDDWSDDETYLTDIALDLHLHCEAAAKECHDMIDTLDAFATTPEGSGYQQQFVEVECRQELVLEEVRAISDIVKRLKSGGVEGGANAAPEGDVAMAILEMQKRCQRVIAKLEGLKGKIGILQQLAESMLSTTQSQEQADG